MKKYAAILLALLLAAYASGCAAKQAEVPELLVPVGAQMDTAIAQRGEMLDLMVYEAAVVPRAQTLSFPRDTRIGEIPVMVGQEVKAGDALVRMDVSAIEGAIAALDAEKASIGDTSDYEKKLYDIDMELYALALSKLTDATARYDLETEQALYDLEFKNAQDARAERLSAIETERAALEAQLSDTALFSPCDGRVVYLGCVPGQQVGAYDAVCAVTDEADLVLKSESIPESVLAGAVELYALIGAEKRAIVPEAVDEDAYARTVLKGAQYLNVFTLDSAAGLSAGDPAAVMIVTARKEDALKVPAGALFEEDGARYVYVVSDGSRARRDVEIGLLTSTEAEIASGLAEGEVVYVGN